MTTEVKFPTPKKEYRYIGYLPEFSAVRVLPKLAVLDHVKVLELRLKRSVHESRSTYTVPSKTIKNAPLWIVTEITMSQAYQNWDIRTTNIPLLEIAESLQSVNPPQDALIERLVVNINPEVLIFESRSHSDKESRNIPFVKEIIQLNPEPLKLLRHPHSLDLIEYFDSEAEYWEFKKYQETKSKQAKFKLQSELISKGIRPKGVDEKSLAKSLLDKLGYSPKRGRIYELISKDHWKFDKFEEL